MVSPIVLISRMTTDDSYLFTPNAEEDERLFKQGELLDPITRRLFVTAGIQPGWRVLDLGSGAGNVSLLAADLVGPDGSVVGIDRDPDAIERASQRVHSQGRTNVEFRTGDVSDLEDLDEEFDAVIGRLVLMYVPDPAAAIRQAAGRVRSGGLVCLEEADMSYTWASPSMPLWDQVRGWFQEAMTRSGARARMGHELFALFRAAGLPDPEMNLESKVLGGTVANGHSWADVVVGALPMIEKLGIATRQEVGPETLGERLSAELVAHDGIMITGPLVGAWTTKP